LFSPASCSLHVAAEQPKRLPLLQPKRLPL
jgi:hypothetical protein